MPALAVDAIRARIVTDTRAATVARLKAKAAELGHAGAPVCAKLVTAEQDVAEGSREVVAIVSCETPDEDGDVILAGGWDLEYFRKHPVCMPFHDYWTYPTGKCLWIKANRRDGQLLAKTRYAERPADFPREQEWVPDTILYLRQQDYMRGYSVGFVILEERMPTAKEIKAHPEWDNCRVIARAKLLEYSDVPLPCNPDAAQIMVAKGLLPKAMQGDTVDVEDDGGDGAGDRDGDGGAVGGERGDAAGADGDTAPDAGDAAAECVDAKAIECDGAGGAGADGDVAGVAGEPQAEEAEGEPEQPGAEEPVQESAEPKAAPRPAPRPAPSPAEIAHRVVLGQIAAGKFTRVDEGAIRRRVLEECVEDRLAYYRGRLD